MTDTDKTAAESLVLYRSDTSSGLWSLYAPGTTYDDIASGDADCLAYGSAKWDDERNDWSRPNEMDYMAAVKWLDLD